MLIYLRATHPGQLSMQGRRVRDNVKQDSAAGSPLMIPGSAGAAHSSHHALFPWCEIWTPETATAMKVQAHAMCSTVYCSQSVVRKLQQQYAQPHEVVRMQPRVTVKASGRSGQIGKSIWNCMAIGGPAGRSLHFRRGLVLAADARRHRLFCLTCTPRTTAVSHHNAF